MIKNALLIIRIKVTLLIWSNCSSLMTIGPQDDRLQLSQFFGGVVFLYMPILWTFSRYLRCQSVTSCILMKIEFYIRDRFVDDSDLVSNFSFDVLFIIREAELTCSPCDDVSRRYQQ